MVQSAYITSFFVKNKQRFREFNLCKQRLFYMLSSRLCVELKAVCYLVSTKTIRLLVLFFYEWNSQLGALLLRAQAIRLIIVR